MEFDDVTGNVSALQRLVKPHLYQGVNELAVGMGGATPLLVRRGGRDIKKISRSLLCWSGRGGHARKLSPGWPPRLRRFGGFAAFCYWRSHPSSRGGDSRPL